MMRANETGLKRANELSLKPANGLGIMRAALVGNPNSGKTTLLNRLTGARRHTGNFPGVTVERWEGRAKDGTLFTDLPGIYSLCAFTSEEEITRGELLSGGYDCLVNVVDACSIMRGLYLTLQLFELGIPFVLVLNMRDEAESSGIEIDTAALERELKIPVLWISAAKNHGIDALIPAMKKAVSGRSGARGRLPGALLSAHIPKLSQELATAAGIPPLFAAVKLLEEDDFVQKILQEASAGSGLPVPQVKHGGGEIAAIERYGFITALHNKCVKSSGSKKHGRNIDALLTNKYFALPFFALVMLAVFALSFGLFGSFFGNITEATIGFALERADALLGRLSAPHVLRSLIVGGVLGGIAGVLSFLPLILLLYFFLSVLEASGYMARVAYVMDRLLQRLGLSGRSAVSLVLGFGCSVPAVLSTRTMQSQKEKLLTILFIPFMSCSAKLPIYGAITALFFRRYRALVLLGLYCLGVVCGIIYLLLAKAVTKKQPSSSYVLELPPYRMPSVTGTFLLLWDRAKDFVARAFTVIFVCNLLVWFSGSFDASLNFVTDAESSMLASAGRLIAPLFAPLGFSDWRLSSALISGLSAKEAVLSTLAVLTGGADLNGLFDGRAEAMSFLVFCLLYMPCFAAFAAVKTELGSRKAAALAMTAQTLYAWLCTFVFYNLCKVFAGPAGQISAVLSALAVFIALCAALAVLRAPACGGRCTHRPPGCAAACGSGRVCTPGPVKRKKALKQPGL